jgi:hypothetical protein
MEVCLCTDASAGDQIQTFRGGEYAGFALQPLNAFRLRLDGQNPGLALHYEGINNDGGAVTADANGWVGTLPMSSVYRFLMAGFRVWLTGAASSDHEVRYTARFLGVPASGAESLPLLLDGPVAVDGDHCSLAEYLGQFANDPRLRILNQFQFALQSIRVSVVRKGCTASLTGGIRVLGNVEFVAAGALAAGVRAPAVGAAAPAAGAGAPAAGAGSPNK